MYRRDNSPTPKASTHATDRHAGPAAGAAAAQSKQTARDIYAEQVRTLYAGARTSMLANSINAAILAYLLWDAASHRALLGWLGSMFLVQGIRLALAHLYNTAPQYRSPGLRADIEVGIGWDRAYLATVAAGGLLWGIAGAWFFPYQTIEHQLTLIFIIGGTVAGATALLAPIPSAFPLFALPALIPLGIRFFLEGTPHYMAMGALTFIFLVVLMNVAHIIHKTLASSIALRLENTELVAALTTKAGNLQQINRLLRTDVNERTAVQDQFRDQILFLQELMDAIPNPVYYKDIHGVYQGCNKALESFLGRSKSGIVGKTVFDIVPTEFAEYHHQKDIELLGQGSAQAFETKLRAADGSLRSVLFCKALYHNPLGAVIGIIGVILDITERKRAEDGLKLFRSLLDHARDSVEVIDPHTGKFIDGNEKAWSNLGYTRDELLSLAVPDIDPMVTASAFAQYVQRLRKTDEPLILESTHLRKDGTTFPVEVSAQLIRQGKEHLIAIVRDITDRKRAEQALRDSKELFEQLSGNVDEVFYITDPEISKILYINQAYEKIWGRPCKALLENPQSFIDAIHEEDRGQALAFLDQLKRGFAEESDYRVVRPDGSIRWVHDRGYSVSNRNQPACVVGIVQDITERKRAEAEWYQSQETLRLIIDNIPQHIFWKDRNLNYLGCNKLFAQAAGTADAAAIVGKSDFDLSWKKTAELYRADDRAVMETGIPKLNFEEPQVKTDGSALVLRTSKVPLLDRAGRVFGMLGIFEDITERKKAEEQIRLITSSLEATANGVVITDTEGMIQWVNQAFTTLTGYRAEEVIGQNPRLLKSGLQNQRFYQQLWDTITAGNAWHGEIVDKRKDGSLYTEEMTITPIRNLHGAISHFVAIKQDISQRKQMEAQTGKVERLAALGQLVGGIAHEIKNPLFILTGRLQLFKEKLLHQEYGALTADLQKIESAAARMTQIAERFLMLVRPSEPKSEATAVQAVLKQTLEFLTNELMKNQIAVTAAIAPDLPTIQTDPRKLQEAFTNLIMNAMQAMAAANGKGTLTVTATLQDSWIEVRIQDDGPGIAPEHRARLFEPFFTTKSADHGTGLGLWTVRTTAIAMRGTVACETETGKGATFILRLPIGNTTTSHG